jgi:hypothetical protein
MAIPSAQNVLYLTSFDSGCESNERLVKLLLSLSEQQSCSKVWLFVTHTIKRNRPFQAVFQA